ncbi:MAG: hypothetical protein ACTSWN_13260 [Promethearchaeota archaeon]
MTFVYDPIKLYMLFIKLMNCILSISIAFRIKKISKYSLNLMFFLAFTGWGIFIGLDGILFVIAPNSLFLYKIANILRDICLAMLGLTSLCFVLSSFVVKEGEVLALFTRRFRLVLAFFLNFFIVLGLILNDHIEIKDKMTGEIIDPSGLPPIIEFYVDFDQNIFAYIFYCTFVFWYVLAVVSIFHTQKQTTGISKLKVRWIMIGMIMIPAGIIYFVIIAFLKTASGSVLGLMVIGQVIWACSPIFVLVGLRIRQHDFFPSKNG